MPYMYMFIIYIIYIYTKGEMWLTRYVYYIYIRLHTTVSADIYTMIYIIYMYVSEYMQGPDTRFMCCVICCMNYIIYWVE